MFKIVIFIANVLNILCFNNVTVSQFPVNEIEDLNKISERSYRRYLRKFEENGRILSDGSNDADTEKYNADLFEVTEKKYNITYKGEQVVKNISSALKKLENNPCVVLLDDRITVHEDAEIYINTLLEDRDVQNDFWLMKFNNSGVTAVLAKYQGDRKIFTDLLKFETNITKTTKYIGPEISAGGVVFFSILKGIRLLPLGGGIMVFTDRNVQDEDLAHLALRELSGKNIKLFVVWQGPYPSGTNEEKLLEETAVLSGGYFFVGNTERKLLTYEQNITNHRQQQSIILYRRNLRGKQQFTFPIDWKIVEICVTLTSVVNTAKLFTPRGFTVDLLDNDDVKKFSLGSDSITVGENYETRLDTDSQDRMVGTWRLDVSAENAHEFNVTVSVQNDLSINAQLVDKYQKQSADGDSESNMDKILRLNIQGLFSTIETVGFVDEKGDEIQQGVPFTLKADLNVVDNIETLNARTVEVDEDDIPENVYFVKVDGKDYLGNNFVRLARYDSERITNRLPTITVEVGAGSELLSSPNKYSNIYFEVTNNAEQMTAVDFICRDERSLLQGMTPRWARINPRQTVIVTVNTYAPLQAGSAYRDTITFTARGSERSDKTAIMYIGTELQVDNENPHVWYRFTSDCLNVLVGYCQDGSWAIEATAQDSETGLMHLTSNPRGLYFSNGYTAGTKEQVTGSLTGSCCQSQIQLTALDLNNNRRVLVADAYYNATLSPGIIAAIVLGILLFIALVLGIVLLCRYRRRRSISIDLPTYRGPSGTTTRRH